MGSWHESCFLSGLAIEPGEKVRWMLITKSPYNTSKGCYSTAFWFPRALPLRGVYDDYGNVTVDDETSVFCKQALSQFQTDLVEKTTEQYRCSAITKDTVSLESLMEWIHEEKLEVLDDKFNDPRKLQTTSIMISERAWQAVMGMTLSLLPYSKKDYCLDKIKYDAYAFADKAEKLVSKTKKMQNTIRLEERSYGEHLFRMDLEKELRGNGIESNAYYWFGLVGGGGAGWPPGCRSPLTTFGEVIFDFYRGDITKDELLVWMLEAAEFMWFDRALGALRKVYSPTGHSGSQSNEHQFVRNFHVAMAGALDGYAQEEKLKELEEKRWWKNHLARERRKKAKATKLKEAKKAK